MENITTNNTFLVSPNLQPILLPLITSPNFLVQSYTPLVILASLLLSFYFILSNQNKYSQLPPGPKPWPIIGCLPEMLKNKPTFRWIHNLMKEMDTEIACIRLGSVHVICVTCPKIAREFLKTQDSVFASRPRTMSTRLLTKGYLTTALGPSGEQWKKMKRILITEVLSPAKHRFFHTKRLAEADHLLRYVYDHCKGADLKGGLVDVRIATRHYCGNLIRNMVFNKRFFGEGMKDGRPGFEEQEHVAAIFTSLAYIYAFSVSDYLPCLEWLDLDGHKKATIEANTIIQKYHDPLIENRVQQWKDGKKEQKEDLLDTLITLKDANGNPLLSVDEIKAQIWELMIETVDNPSNAVEWAIAEMINQPEILKKATEELDKVVGKERLVQESDFSQLNYIKACAREAFRLHPLDPFNVPHVSISDSKVGNYFIPNGSHVLLSRLGLGRNPKVWDDPHKFNPERHLKNDGSEVVLTEDELRFISFSRGKRGCPGVMLGTSLTIMLLSRLLQGFNWEVPPGDQSSINLTESEEYGLTLATPLLALAKPRLPQHLYP